MKDKLRIDLTQVMECFDVNYVVLNSDKCHCICLGKDTEHARFSFDGNTSVNRKEEKLLGIIIDNDLSFDTHIKEVCKKASQKLATLSHSANCF